MTTVKCQIVHVVRALRGKAAAAVRDLDQPETARKANQNALKRVAQCALVVIVNFLI